MLENAFRCLAAAAFCAIFAGIYELFSHGVYSGFMIGACAIPLLLGAVPAACIGLYVRKQAEDPGNLSRQKEEDAAEGLSGVETAKITCKSAETYDMMDEHVPEAAGSAADVPGAYAGRMMTEKSGPGYDAGDPYGREMAGEKRPAGICMPGTISRNAWFSGLAALTVGSIFRGVLDIYGTTNRLIAVYPAAAAVLMCAALAVFLISFVTARRAGRRYASL